MQVHPPSRPKAAESRENSTAAQAKREGQEWSAMCGTATEAAAVDNPMAGGGRAAAASRAGAGARGESGADLQNREKTRSVRRNVLVAPTGIGRHHIAPPGISSRVVVEGQEEE